MTITETENNDMTSVHEVTVARAAFEYTPVTDVPSWWKPGQRVVARRGAQITVNDEDYERGRKYASFVDEPPMPTREVTVRHGCFEYTPQPYSSGEPEGLWRRTAFRGETVRVLEEEYERGVKHGVFEKWVPESGYGLIGDPPLRGSVVEWHNWVNGADEAAIELLMTHLAALAGEHREQLQLVEGIRTRLRRPDVAENLNQSHELAKKLVAAAEQEKARVSPERAELVEKILDKLITNPEAVARILAQD